MQTESKVLEIRDSSKPYKDRILINIRKNHKATMSLFSPKLIEENGYEAGQSSLICSMCLCISWALTMFLLQSEELANGNILVI